MVPELMPLDERRKSLYTRMKIFDTIIIVSLISAGIYLVSQVPQAICHAGMFGFFIGFGLVALNHYLHINASGYYGDFKLKVIGKVISFLGEDFTYTAKGNIAKSEYLASRIFQTSPYASIYRGDDLIKGRLGEIKITMSELYTGYTTGSGKHRTTHTIFKGLFIAAVFPRNFKDNLIMTMSKGNFDNANYLPQGAANSLSSISTSRDVKISYQENKMYMAISYKEDLFEPKMDKSLLDYYLVADYYSYLRFAMETAEGLIKDSGMWGSEEVYAKEIYTGQEKEISCPSCGGPVPENNRFCIHCGSQIV